MGTAVGEAFFARVLHDGDWSGADVPDEQNSAGTQPNCEKKGRGAQCQTNTIHGVPPA